jgi:hypothetical protein
MKRVFVALLFCLALLNCAKKEEKPALKNKPYIISHEDEKFRQYSDSLKKNSNKVALPYRKEFYGESQLIIDKKGNLFYYQKEYILILCAYGREKDTLPHFLDLKPKDIIKIPQKHLNDFISENILTKEKNRQILIIASQSDTIKNAYFLNFLKSNIIQKYHIRRTTQEEDTVLKYRTKSDYYYSDSIKWDRSKIKFPTKN